MSCAAAGACFGRAKWTRLIRQKDDLSSFAMSLDFHCVVSQVA